MPPLRLAISSRGCSDQAPDSSSHRRSFTKLLPFLANRRRYAPQVGGDPADEGYYGHRTLRLALAAGRPIIDTAGVGSGSRGSSGGARLGVDVGGTFTDLVLLFEASLTTTKVPSTPRDQSAGVLAAIESAAIDASGLAAFAQSLLTHFAPEVDGWLV